MFEENNPPNVVSPGATELQRANCSSPFRYFVIKAGQLKNIDLSVSHRVWAFLPMTQTRIVNAYKSGKTVILVFSIQGSGHFQGYARLTGDSPVGPDLSPPEMIGPQLNPPLPVEWIKRCNIPHHATRHLYNPYNDYAKVQMSRDGQEIEPSVGEALCQLWDNVSWSGPNHFSRGPRLNRPNFNNYKIGN